MNTLPVEGFIIDQGYYVVNHAAMVYNKPILVTIYTELCASYLALRMYLMNHIGM